VDMDEKKMNCFMVGLSEAAGAHGAQHSRVIPKVRQQCHHH
jgi:hypothetical protein